MKVTQAYRFALDPTPSQMRALRSHAGAARFAWNWGLARCSERYKAERKWHSAADLHRLWNAAKKADPALAWWPENSKCAYQEAFRNLDRALRDFARAMAAFFAPGNPTGRPSWRKAGRHEGFRIVGRRGRQWDVRRLSRKTGAVWVPKAGWVRFRWSRAVPPGVKSYRVTKDRAGRWHVAFVARPDPVPALGDGEVVGIDRGVAVAAALSNGELLCVPGLTVRVTARGGCREAGPVNREPQLLASLTGCE